MKSHVLFPVGLILGFAGLASLGMAQREAEKSLAKDFFKNRVAPLLRKHCLECHNPDKARGSLDLSSRAAMLEGGDKGPAIIVGQARKSLLLDMVDGVKPRMPLKRDPLSREEVNDLRLWIDAGAPWPEDVVLHTRQKKEREEWWSLKTLERPPLPKVKDRTWSDNPIDRFILATLEAKGMKPSAPVDRKTFIRRVTYDLTGLPPTPNEIDAFVNDTAADAFERLVDRLLDSPRYGERWARHWLDIIHYADTHGFDKDKRRLWAWLFRDWVIRSFNGDMPFRRFLQYQLAGDVLFPGDPDGVIATGFIAAGPWDFVGQVELREGTVDKEKTRTLDRDDMVANAFTTFTSLTVHCARCHDHKFDPIPQKDYYQLQAIFSGLERGDREVETKDTLVVRDNLEKKLREVSEQRAKLHSKRLEVPEIAAYESKLHKVQGELVKLKSSATTPPASPTNGYHSQIVPRQDMTKWVQVDLGESVPLDWIRLVPARPTDFKDSPGFGFPLRFKVAISDDATFKVETIVFDALAEDFPSLGDVALSIAVQGKSARYVRVTATKLWNRTNDYIFALGELQAFSKGENAATRTKVSALDTIDAGRWNTRHLVDGFDSRRRLPENAELFSTRRIELEANLVDLQHKQKNVIAKLVPGELQKRLDTLKAQEDRLRQELGGLKQKSMVYTVLPRAPRPIHVLLRGDVERKGDLVAPAGLSMLRGLDPHFGPWQSKDAKAPAEEGPRRAALARWFADDNNPLVWRSIVNRVWHYHFGKGLVDTPNDFGKMGSRPSHPELLNWLASEFRSRDSFKHLHRMIVLSQTYRQSSGHNAEYAKIDADNRLLWRMNRQRLDAESLRDTILAVSGKLDWTMYGPGYDLFRFKDDHSPTYDHLDLKRVNAPDTWRRTVYRFVVRSVPNPFLENLDCADPNLSVPVRNTTQTALQALALLNNPFMVEQAEFFAQRIQKQATDLPGQIDLAVQLTLGRSPEREESQRLLAYAQRHGLANTCRVIFNLNEFMFVD